MNELHDQVLKGLRFLAGKCDGARTRDDVGFDQTDTHRGHYLADQETLNEYDVKWGLQRCFKYRRQLGPDFIDTLTMLSLDTGLTPEEGPMQLEEYDPILTQDLTNVFVLTDEQEAAIALISEWFDGCDGYDEFKLGGYAGTGKTTIIKHLRAALHAHVIVCAFTGKAVNVLQRKGVISQTMHSLMYDVIEDKDGNITFQKKSCMRDEPDLVIVDEGSMVSTELYNDLKSFGKPVLFVGDPGQLEPVGDNPNLMRQPDFVLSKIHRQAERSPIIQLATGIRLGTIIRPPLVESEELVVKPKVVRASEYLAADQIICARNLTRTNLNKSIRVQKGYPPDTIVKGEKLICLRNNRQRGVFNGMILFVDEVLEDRNTYFLCKLHDEVGRTMLREKVWKEPFILPISGKEARPPFDHIYCDYGYVITCHKSQGSEWDHVIVLDERVPPTLWDMKRWRYTAITRAAKKLTFCI